MNLEGRLTIGLQKNGEVGIHSSRPLGIVGLFVGKTPSQLLDLLPLIFPLCGTAQSYCGLQACRQALREPADPPTAAVQRRLVDLETVKEHALRMLLDWPEFMGEPPDAAAARTLAAALPRWRAAWFGPGPAFTLDSRATAAPDAARATLAMLEEILSRQLFGATAEEWLAGVAGAADLRRWAETGATIAARLIRDVLERDWPAAAEDDLPHLPQLGDADLARRLESPDAGAFCASPDWGGHPRETTALSRQRDTPLVTDLERHFGKGLLTRLAARLVELATLTLRLRASLTQPPPAPEPPCPPPALAIGQVEAARGRLIHALALHQGRIARYHIVAPTEWNFHPRGPAARALAALPPGAERRRQAELLINAIDPCVAYELRIDG